MRSHGYKTCLDCNTTVSPRKTLCVVCADNRRSKREAEYRQLKRDERDKENNG